MILRLYVGLSLLVLFASGSTDILDDEIKSLQAQADKAQLSLHLKLAALEIGHEDLLFKKEAVEV